MSRFILVYGSDTERQGFAGVLDIEKNEQDMFYLELVRVVNNAVDNTLNNAMSIDIAVSYECWGTAFDFYEQYPFNGEIECAANIFVEE